MLRMARPFLFLFVSGCIVAASGCARPPPQWTQFHADAANQGSMWVETKHAATPRWSVEVGQTLFSSPAIGADRIVYVGTFAGDLVAVNPDGTVRWRVSFPGSSIYSSPAVGAEGFGDIYIVSTRKIDDRPASTLHAVAADGTRRWSFDLPRNGYTLASPKEWGGHIFLYARASSEAPIGLNELLVFDRSGRLVAREIVHGCPVTVIGSSPLDRILELLACAPACYDPHLRPFQPDPTVAIVDYPDLAARPVVVVADDCSVRAYHWVWSPARLNLLWHQRSDQLQYCSPVVLRFPAGGGAVIVMRNGPTNGGDERSEALAYDIRTGTKLWERRFEEWIAGATAAPGTIVYIAYTSKLRAFAPESGEMFFEASQPSGGFVAPAMSGAFLHLSLHDGMQSASFDLLGYYLDRSARGGRSSPAIAGDGTVYMVTTTGQLRAYPPP
jgi:PQQ-like domain